MMSARARATRLTMPPERSAGMRVACSGLRPTICSLTRAAARTSSSGRVPCSRRAKATLSSTLKAENSAPCWNSMPTRLAAPSPPHFRRRAAQHGDGAARGLRQAQNLAQQHGFARARAADQRQHFAALHDELQVLVHGKGFGAFAEHRPQPFGFDDGRFVDGVCALAWRRGWPTRWVRVRGGHGSDTPRCGRPRRRSHPR